MISSEISHARYAIAHYRTPDGSLNLTRNDTIKLLSFLSDMQDRVEVLENSDAVDIPADKETTPSNNVVQLFPSNKPNNNISA